MASPTCRPRGGGNVGSGLQENSALMGLSFQSHDDCDRSWGCKDGDDVDYLPMVVCDWGGERLMGLTGWNIA